MILSLTSIAAGHLGHPFERIDEGTDLDQLSHLRNQDQSLCFSQKYDVCDGAIH